MVGFSSMNYIRKTELLSSYQYCYTSLTDMSKWQMVLMEKGQTVLSYYGMLQNIRMATKLAKKAVQEDSDRERSIHACPRLHISWNVWQSALTAQNRESLGIKRETSGAVDGKDREVPRSSESEDSRAWRNRRGKWAMHSVCDQAARSARSGTKRRWDGECKQQGSAESGKFAI